MPGTYGMLKQPRETLQAKRQCQGKGWPLREGFPLLGTLERLPCWLRAACLKKQRVEPREDLWKVAEYPR